MKLRKSFTLAISSILSNKMRSFLTMLGIIIGVAAVIILVSIMDGVTGQVTDVFESMGTNNIMVNITPRGGNRIVSADDMYELAEKYPDYIKYVTPSVSLQRCNVKSRESTESLERTTVTGVGEDYIEISKLEMQTGRFLQYVDMAQKSKVAVIGNYVAKELYGSAEKAIGQTLKLNGEPFAVVGVLEEKEDSSEGSADDKVFIPYSRATKMSWMSVITSYTVAAVDEEKVDVATKFIESKLFSILQNSNNYTITAMKEVLDQVSTVTDTLKIALVCIAGISLLVGGIGIMNIMLVSVTERTREIGIRKSLGAKRKNILQQFVIEAGTVSGIGGVLGILVGVAVSSVAGKLLGIDVVASQNAVMLAFGVSVAIGICFGFLPANKASKLNPIDALRHD